MVEGSGGVSGLPTLGMEQYEHSQTCFIAWMVALGKVRIRERLVAAGICSKLQTHIVCYEINVFRCPFSRRVCIQIMEWLNIRSAIYMVQHEHW